MRRFRLDSAEITPHEVQSTQKNAISSRKDQGGSQKSPCAAGGLRFGRYLALVAINLHFSGLDMQQAGKFWRHSPTVLSERRLVAQTRAHRRPRRKEKINAVKTC